MMLSLRSLWRLADELRTKVGGSSSGDARNDKIWAEIDCNGTEIYTTSVSLSGVARKFSQRCVTTPLLSPSTDAIHCFWTIAVTAQCLLVFAQTVHYYRLHRLNCSHNPSMDGMGPTDTNHHPNFVAKISLDVRKAKMMALTGGEKFWPSLCAFSRFVIFRSVTDRQTDGRNCCINIVRCIHVWLNTESCFTNIMHLRDRGRALFVYATGVPQSKSVFGSEVLSFSSRGKKNASSWWSILEAVSSVSANRLVLSTLPSSSGGHQSALSPPASSHLDVAANLTDDHSPRRPPGLHFTHHIRITVLEPTIRASDPGAARSSVTSIHIGRRATDGLMKELQRWLLTSAINIISRQSQ